MRDMDNNVIVGPQTKVGELAEDMGHTMLLRPGKPTVTVDGFKLMISPQLIEDIVQDTGLASSTKKCATAGVKNRVVDGTPLEKEEHSNFRTQVGRLLFLSVLRPDLLLRCGTARETCLGTNRLGSHCLETPHSNSVDDTRHEAGTLPVGTSGALGHGRRRLGKPCGTQICDKGRVPVGGMLCGKLVADSGIVCAEQM